MSTVVSYTDSIWESVYPTLSREEIIHWTRLWCSEPEIPSDCSGCAGGAKKGNTQKSLQGIVALFLST